MSNADKGLRLEDLSEKMIEKNRIGKKGERTKHAYIEDYASLIIAGRGAWNELFNHKILHDFGARDKGYCTTKCMPTLCVS